MNAKRILIAAALVLVAAIYYYLYKDSFGPAAIQIHVTQRQRLVRARPPRAGAPAPPPPAPEELLTFTFGQKYQLTEITVAPLEALKTNKFTHPCWHLISDTNSTPIDNVIYGRAVRGMKPAIKGATAEPLLPDTEYRVMVAAGKVKGAHDFKTPPADPPPE